MEVLASPRRTSHGQLKHLNARVDRPHGMRLRGFATAAKLKQSQSFGFESHRMPLRGATAAAQLKPAHRAIEKPGELVSAVSQPRPH